jgi:hypothetical protein
VLIEACPVGELVTHCQRIVIKSGFVVTPNPPAWEIKMTTTQYDAAYGNFQTSLYEEIRREAFGEDIGQNSWLTAGEQDKFLSWFGLAAGKTLLDVACGAGGPAL